LPWITTHGLHTHRPTYTHTHICTHSWLDCPSHVGLPTLRWVVAFTHTTLPLRPTLWFRLPYITGWLHTLYLDCHTVIFEFDLVTPVPLDLPLVGYPTVALPPHIYIHLYIQFPLWFGLIYPTEFGLPQLPLIPRLHPLQLDCSWVTPPYPGWIYHITLT